MVEPLLHYPLLMSEHDVTEIFHDEILDLGFHHEKFQVHFYYLATSSKSILSIL